MGRKGTEIASFQFGDVSDHGQITMPRDFSMRKPYCNGTQVIHTLLNSVYTRKKWTLRKVWPSRRGEFSASVVPLPVGRAVLSRLSPTPLCWKGQGGFSWAVVGSNHSRSAFPRPTPLNSTFKWQKEVCSILLGSTWFSQHLPNFSFCKIYRILPPSKAGNNPKGNQGTAESLYVNSPPSVYQPLPTSTRSAACIPSPARP